MLLAVLTALPIAIAGAILHLLAHTVYKSCLFFCAGIIDNVKSQTLSYKNNLYIFICFILATASFIGVPFFAAFYSKELIYEGALNSGIALYIVTLLITFFCSSAVFDWMSKIFFGNDGKYKEYPLFSMIPVVTSALLCLLLGVFKKVPLAIIESQIYFPEHTDAVLMIISLAALLVALLNFIIGYAKYKNGLGFVSGLTSFLRIDKLNENDALDPYAIALKVYGGFAGLSFDFDKSLNWIYDNAFVTPVLFFSNAIRKIHNGSLSRYIIWALAGIALIIIFFV
jgi:NADH:ubiquinone oxidoreductase subunit 5 (subunit L)/multisubunit Na+/H+ antiporter MnhA subunit